MSKSASNAGGIKPNKKGTTNFSRFNKKAIAISTILRLRKNENDVYDFKPALSPISSILGYIRQAKDCEQHKVHNHSGSYRILLCDSIIGFNQEGCSTSHLTVIIDSKGNILTAFPGKYQPKEKATEISETVLAGELVGLA